MTALPTWRSVVALGAVLGLVGSVARAGQGPARDVTRPALTGTAVLVGTVIADDPAHSPVRHATLTLSRLGANDERITATDELGRFAFPDLPAATYTLAASKPAYLAVKYGAVSVTSSGLPIPIGEGQHFTAQPIVLVHGAAITGRVLDPNGRPLANIIVRAMPAAVMSGQGPLGLGLTSGAFGPTDSRGIYRIFGLPAGDYVVTAAGAVLSGQSMTAMTPAAEQWLAQHQGQPGAPSGSPPAAGRPFVAAPTFFPGTAEASKAAVVTVAHAEERSGVDITVVRVATARLAGIVYDPAGQPAAGAVVFRLTKDPTPTPLLGAQARTSPDGSFVMTGVTPGDYNLAVRAASGPAVAPSAGSPGLPSGALTLWAESEVTVGGEDLTDLAIHLQPGMTVSGTVVFEGTARAPENVAGFRPTLAASDRRAPLIAVTGGGQTTQSTTDRTFAIEGVTPGSYHLTGVGAVPTLGGQPPVWAITSIRRDGHDLLDTAFEIRPGDELTNVVATYSDRHTVLEGRLLTAAGQPASALQILVYPANRTLWSGPSLTRWTATVRAAVDGSFRVTGLPSGDFYVCALTDIDPSQPQDAAFFESLVSASQKMTLIDGETHTQTFRVGG